MTCTYLIPVVYIEIKYTIRYRPNKNFDNFFETSFTCLDKTILRKVKQPKPFLLQ